MIEDIGVIAGRIWTYLDLNGEVSLTNLKKDLDLKSDQVALSLGWLARENQLVMEKKGSSVKVQLNK